MEDTGIESVIVATLPVERETLAVAEMTLPVSDSMTLEVVTVEFKDEVDILAETPTTYRATTPPTPDWGGSD